MQTILNFWWDLESFDKKVWPVTRFLQCRLSQVFDGTWKVSAKRCDQLHIFFAVETNLEFLEREMMWPEKLSQKSFGKNMWPVTHVFSQTILSFRWDLESFGKNMWPVTHFFRSADYLKFLMGLGKFRQKDVTSYTFFAVETILSVWGDLESFDKKICSVTRFFRCGD